MVATLKNGVVRVPLDWPVDGCSCCRPADRLPDMFWNCATRGSCRPPT